MADDGLPTCSILFTYPQIAGIAGLQGVLVYAFASALPFLTFPPLAKRIRKLCPHGFVLTEYVRERFGVLPMLFLSACSCLTMWVSLRSSERTAGLLTSIQVHLHDLRANEHFRSGQLAHRFEWASGNDC